MRVLVVVAVVVALARVALAGTTTCYAGVDESGDARISIVIVREVDRDAREIRTTKWRANAPHRTLKTTSRVAADDHAFEFDARGIHGTGALDGAPWAWTGYHQESKAFGGTLLDDVKLGGDRWRGETRFEHAGLVRWRVATVAKTFDCRELARRRAALDDSAPDATRTCFEGTQTIYKNTSPVVVEQIVERKRIVFITASPMLDNRLVLAIDGSSITASNGHAWTGTGALDGKRGAWTGYSYRARIDGSDVEITGTIGGTRITRSDVDTGRAQRTATLDAAAFACAHLDDRLAALTAAP